ncbi:GAF domain-containing protein [Lysobacter koreensis]|uniref:GAF domain-containing protein n=1 Tax=Lysobacter koreensis TaxID=266122 RepID=A0ABW2YNV5_9GAMM
MSKTYRDPIQTRIERPQRLAAVVRTGLLDTPPEPSLDQLTALAAQRLGVPATFISLVDRDRDFYKSHFGFGEPLNSVRQLEGRTFCHYAIGSDQPLVIDDTTRDPVYRDVPTVTTLGVRSYLGVPLVMEDGEVIGSFCAIDFEPRHWRSEDVATMVELAQATMREIRLRVGQAEG